MKEEALKLADELDLIAGMIAIGDRIKWGQDSELMENGSAMIRRLVAENSFLKDWRDTWTPYVNQLKQTKPLSDEEIWDWFEKNTALTKESALMIARAIEERHGIK